MRLIDLDQEIFIPVVDESENVSYEIKMSIAEMFEKFMDGFVPEIVNAISVEWLVEKMRCADDAGDLDATDVISWLIQTWQKEQEAR